MMELNYNCRFSSMCDEECVNCTNCLLEEDIDFPVKDRAKSGRRRRNAVRSKNRAKKIFNNLSMQYDRLSLPYFNEGIHENLYQNKCNIAIEDMPVYILKKWNSIRKKLENLEKEFSF